jgi:2,4-didehydro-3-deoxy-L-rhamnonate hydrolase
VKLVRIGPPGQERPAVLVAPHHALDVGHQVNDFDHTFFRTGGLERLRELVDSSAEELPTVELNGMRLGPPVARPSQIICVGLNYADHAAESGAAIPEEPTLFGKAPNTLVGPSDDVLIPIGGTKTDWEVELAVVIGSTARYLPDPGASREVIAGYSVSNDVSERAFQLERGGQWVKGKSCETFNPLGPWLVTPDEIPEPQQLHLWLEVNGERMQDSSTAQMIFGVAHIVWYVSQFMVLEPGDLLNTGTPAGVGLGLQPPRYLRPGDVMRLGIEGLGEQLHVCRQARR